MRRAGWIAGILGILVGVGATGTQAVAAKGRLRLSAAGVPVGQGENVGYRLVLRPAGFSGSALQIGGGPLVNEAALDSLTAREGGDAQGAWDVTGSVEAITLAASGKARIIATGEAIADNEPEPVEPPPPPRDLSGPLPHRWECFYPLPKQLNGTFSTAGSAVVSGTTRAKPSKLCNLPGFAVSFTLELLPGGRSGPPLETSLVR